MNAQGVCFQSFSRRRDQPQGVNSRPFFEREEFPDEDLNDLTSLTKFTQLPEQIKTTSPDINRSKPTSTVTRRPSAPTVIQRPSLEPTGGPLKCFSCGSLFGDSNCTEFNPTDRSQIQTCGSDQACLLYTWKKSPEETAVIRECFTKGFVIGPVDNPLTVTRECTPRDISEPDVGINGASACLCETPFCNNLEQLQAVAPDRNPTIINEIEGPVDKIPDRRKPAPTSRPGNISLARI